MCECKQILAMLDTPDGEAVSGNARETLQAHRTSRTPADR
jgi:hypothetical protein